MYKSYQTKTCGIKVLSHYTLETELIWTTDCKSVKTPTKYKD